MAKKLTLTAAIELMEILQRTQKFPEDPTGVELLASTLIEAAPEPEFAAKVIEELRRTCRYCPSDAEIFAAANSLRVPEWKPLEKCPAGKCDGSGWIEVSTPYKSGVKSCECRASRVA